MALSAGTRLGPYEIVSLVGAGGMGEVYRARDGRLGRDVAVKVLPASVTADPERLHRFEHEARAAAALNHPNILAVYDIGQHDGAPYIVSELLEGETLRQRLNDGALPVRKAVEYAIQLAHGLAAAHEKGIVHRDLKPENIFLTGDGRLKILDFGLAKLTQAEPALTGLSMLLTTPPQTQAGLVLGTVGYMSPEQVRALAADQRSDIFASGANLYEMLTGQKAFRGDTAADTMTAILKEHPPDVSISERHVSVAIQRILDRCLEKNPAGRFQSAGDLAFALEGLSSQSGEVTALGPTPTRVRRERALWAAVGTLALTVAALAIGITRYSQSTAVKAPEMRLDMVTPPTSDPISLAISPDGRTLVFVASPQGTSQLWLRSLDSGKAEPLAGTERASYPFWSPDGRAIGFFVDGKLKRIDIAGGPAQTLATVSRPYGGAWGTNGVMLVGNGGARPITRVSPTGGDLTAFLRLEPGQSFHYFPQFLPDGRHFIYAVQGTPLARGIYAGSIDGSGGKRLLTDLSTAVYVPASFLLYVRQGVLLAQRFDVQQLALVGEAFRLDDDISFSPSTGAAAVSASAFGTIVYRTGATGPALAWFDRMGNELRSVNGPDRAGPGGPQLSPDGLRLAVWRTVDGNTDIYVIDATRGIPSRFTVDEAVDGWQVWSPDGSQLVFASNRKGQFDLYRKFLRSGGSEEPVFESSSNKYPMDWSSDGRFILYGQVEEKTGYDVWALPLFGDRKPFPILITSFDERYPEFSPDGRWVAYQSNESGQDDIYVQPFPGPGERSRISTNGGAQVRWRRDGRELFYIAPDRQLMAVAVIPTSPGEKFEAGPPRALFLSRIWNSAADLSSKQEYVVSPDGQRFLMLVEPRDVAAPPIRVITNWAGGRR